MDYVVVALFAMAGGALCTFLVLEDQRRKVQKQRREHNASAETLKNAIHSLKEREEHFERESQRIRTEQAEFRARAIQFNELQDENSILKRDLRTLDLQIRKLQLDHVHQCMQQETLDRKIADLGSRYLKDNVRWLGSSLNANNFVVCKQRLQDVIERCRAIGLQVPTDEEIALQSDLKSEYQKILRVLFQREEQARIKAQIREEQLRQQEIDRELKQLDREREAIKVALQKALADAQYQHSEEVERLRARLAEAEERSQRAISQAQLTRSGHVYVISNIGSFGDGVFKVGMTRRLEPDVRVNELGSASVPFPFDIHMMISSNDAPALENALHRKLFKRRINKMNPRKEFFKTDISAIYEIVKAHHGEVEYIVDSEALQYRQSLTMSDEDQQFIERVYDEAEEDAEFMPDTL